MRFVQSWSFLMDNFISIGTDKLSIGKRIKMGTRSLDSLPFREYSVLDKNQTIVVLIRDVIGKWKSGYKQELEEKFEHGTNLFNFVDRPENVHPQVLRRFWQRLKYGYYTTFTDPDEVTLVGLEIMQKLHDYYADLNWIHYSHAEFWMWNDDSYKSLWELALLPNVYFLDLSRLSNPKFLKWLQEKDRLFENVEEDFIGHFGDKLSNSNVSKTLDLFWEKYDESSNFLSNHVLVRPDFSIIETHSPKFDDETINNRFFYQYKIALEIQNMINHIKNNNPRFLNFK